LRLANYTVSRTIDALETQGLVERRQDEMSRRTHRVYLTAAGRDLMPALFSIIAAQNKQMMAGLSQKDQAEFLRLMALLSQP